MTLSARNHARLYVHSDLWKELKYQMEYVEDGYKTLQRAKTDYERTGLRSDKLYKDDVAYNLNIAIDNMFGILCYAADTVQKDYSKDLVFRIQHEIDKRNNQSKADQSVG